MTSDSRKTLKNHSLGISLMYWPLTPARTMSYPQFQCMRSSLLLKGQQRHGLDLYALHGLALHGPLALKPLPEREIRHRGEPLPSHGFPAVYHVAFHGHGP